MFVIYFEMTISVLMSTYSLMKTEYLRQSFDSIWTKQTLRPNEIILVEDGPIGKEQEELIAEWKEKLGDILIICMCKENQGLTKALNVGIRHVTSDLIARVDCDDVSAPNRFRLQHDYLEQHPDIDILGGAMQEFSRDNPCICIRTYPITDEEVRKYILKASPLAHPSVMMRTRMFRNGLKYNERYRTSQDIALWYDALLAGYKISNLDDVILFFRRSNGVMRRRAKKKAKNECLIYMNGIYRMKGLFTLSYIYPLMRFLIRNLPIGLISWFYNSKLRTYLLKSK